MNNHSKVYQEIEKLKVKPANAKNAALQEIELMETDFEYAKKLKFNPLEWRIQRAFNWDETPENLQKLWPQLMGAQFQNKHKIIHI